MGIRRMCEGGVEGGIWERGLGDRDIGLRCGDWKEAGRGDLERMNQKRTVQLYAIWREM